MVLFFKYSLDKNIYYEEHGSGEPLVFFPGWTMDHTVFRQQPELFAKTHRVVLFDPPGCGQSSRFDSYSFELYLKVFNGLLKHLNIETAHLAGWSMGGELLIKYCAEHPGVARSLVLVCATPCFVQLPDWSFAMSLAAAKRFRKNLARDPKSTLELFRTEALKWDSSPESARLLLKAGSHTDLKAAVDLFDQLMSQDFRPLIDRLRLPVYVLAGSRDVVCPPGASAYLAQNIPDAKQDTLETGHTPFSVQPALFNSKVEWFLRSIGKYRANEPFSAGPV
jgi:pimeloyl-ACP methyl ester carboxylesterase